MSYIEIEVGLFERVEPKIREVEYYRTNEDKTPFRNWHVSLKDRAMQARVDARITRLKMGLFGKCEPVGDGVFELKDDYGPGYRLYFAEECGRVILLLCGGNKSSQQPTLIPLNRIGRIISNEERSQKPMSSKTANYADDLRDRLRDPAYAAEYLNAVLADDSEGIDAVFLLALREIAEAVQMSKVAGNARVNRENLYRMLSGKGNPRFTSLIAVLKALGLRLSIVPSAPPSCGEPEARQDDDRETSIRSEQTVLV